MKENINQRIEALRNYMCERGIHAFIFPSTDPHAGEYIPSHWKSRAWISGFNGSAGTAVVTLDKAALWTDARYFLAAEEQLAETSFVLMKERITGTPSIAEWLCENMDSEQTVGIDGTVNSITFTSSLHEALKRKQIHLRTEYDPSETLWTDRPRIPQNPVIIHPLEYAGKSTREKISELRKTFSTDETEALLITALDEIAWTLNLRGNDVPCNPVFVSYLLLTKDETILFISPEKLTEEVRAYLANEGVETTLYKDIFHKLRVLNIKGIQLPPETNYALVSALPVTCKTKVKESPVASLKAIKNEKEISGFRQAMVRDGVALVKFLRWLKPAVEAGGETEISIDKKLTSLRAAQPLYRDISFDTIAGYQEHGAIIHYKATPETEKPLHPEGLLLLDSGAQYADGTTDITRTIALGPLTEEQKLNYTLVLKGHIMLSSCKFPECASGTQIDVCARYAMWQEGMNFGHGTGHGVGSYLNVHEGPHQIRMNYVAAPIYAHMTITNEPGLYIPGKYGIRIENTLLTIPFCETEFGRFIGFEPLTLCPIDTAPILMERMTPEEIIWLNDYHKTVCDRILPSLENKDDREWLINATKPINK